MDLVLFMLDTNAQIPQARHQHGKMAETSLVYIIYFMLKGCFLYSLLLPHWHGPWCVNKWSWLICWEEPFFGMLYVVKAPFYSAMPYQCVSHCRVSISLLDFGFILRVTANLTKPDHFLPFPPPNPIIASPTKWKFDFGKCNFLSLFLSFDSLGWGWDRWSPHPILSICLKNEILSYIF